MRGVNELADRDRLDSLHFAKQLGGPRVILLVAIVELGGFEPRVGGLRLFGDDGFERLERAVDRESLPHPADGTADAEREPGHDESGKDAAEENDPRKGPGGGTSNPEH